ncbi:MAG: YibE/F family protein, partial [Actinomycetota bacterium]
MIRTQVPRRLWVTLAVIMALVLGVTVAGLILLWPKDVPADTNELGIPSVLYDATVISSRTSQCMQSQPDDNFRCTLTRARLADGRSVVFESTQGPGVVTLGAKDKIVLGFSPDSPPGLEYYFADYQRTKPLLLLTAIFAVMVIALGRIKGVAALAGMAVTMLILIKFVLPAILAGKDPLLVATVGAAVIMFIALYVAHGINVRTTMAILGTFAALALTGLLALIFVELTRLTGFSSEEAIFLQISADQI